jgi:hypothetical protein
MRVPITAQTLALNWESIRGIMSGVINDPWDSDERTRNHLVNLVVWPSIMIA